MVHSKDTLAPREIISIERFSFAKPS